MDYQSSAPLCWSNVVKQQQPPLKHSAVSPVAAAAMDGPGGRVLVESCKSTKGIAVAVVDANAIIQGGEKLSNSSERFVSVSEVLNEIRDPKSRHSLNFLPFTVDTMEPSPDALKKAISFARATGDLQTLSDVDLKLIALTYTLEAQIHGTQHLRDSPPPIHVVNVKRLPEKDMPGWGANVPNLEEWEALEHVDSGSDPCSKILPLKDLNLNTIPSDRSTAADNSTSSDVESLLESQEDSAFAFTSSRRYQPKKKVIQVEGKKMVADGIDASRGQINDDAGDWCPAVSRSTHRRYLRRKARREMYGAPSDKDEEEEDVNNTMVSEIHEGDQSPKSILPSEELSRQIVEGSEVAEENNGDGELATILNQMRLEEESSRATQVAESLHDTCEDLTLDAAHCDNNGATGEGEDIEAANDGFPDLETESHTSETAEDSQMDDSVSEQSWIMRSLSESSVACITGDFAMQNVLLQMGLRIVAPGGMQIRELHRWILRCHACYKVTTEIGRVFCPSCGNGGTLRKVAVTVGENGILLAARKQRTSLRGTKFSLPLPQGGRDAITKNPILREDQLPKKYMHNKKKKNKQGDDVFAPDDIFLHHTDKKTSFQPPMRKALAVFSGKRNPNDNHFSRAKH